MTPLAALLRENGELWWEDLFGFKLNRLPYAKGFKVAEKVVEVLTSALIPTSKPTWRILNSGTVWASKELIWTLNLAGNVVFTVMNEFRAG